LKFKVLLKAIMNHQIIHLKRQIRYLLVFFIIALVISGATASPAETELGLLLPHLPAYPAIYNLINTVFHALQATNRQYPFLLYGYDWLAFAHYIIAIAFIGPVKDPVKNKWVVEFGMIACLLVIPFALTAGSYRAIPVWWRLIDCSFGVCGIIPLGLCRQKIIQLEKMIAADKLNLIF
jgi:hypothetical protein